MNFPLLSSSTLLIGACVFLAGVVDALAGGGGLITLPAYLAFGLNPALVLGTNKFVSCIGTFAASIRYYRRLGFSLKHFLPALLAAAIASVIGARLALMINPLMLRPLLLIALPLLAWILWSRPKYGEEDHSHAYSLRDRQKREISVSIPIAAYDGFFGPGAGTFYALSLSHFCGYTLLASTARTKALNLISNLAALITFMLWGRVSWSLGIPMALLSICGNWLGSHLGLTRGAKIIRPAVIVVCSLLFVKMLTDMLGSY